MSTPHSSLGQQGALGAAEWRVIIERAPLLFEVNSDSMFPSIRRGEKVRIRPLLPGEPRPGQVLAFHRGMLVIHRYLGKGRCRGDNTLAVDNEILRGEMVGIAHTVLRGEREETIKEWSRAWMMMRRWRLWLAALRGAARFS
jgi:hypothetical protein